jgi:hypothetical protein
MNKIEELLKARGLLNQALLTSNNLMPNDRAVQEARMHMRKALSELDAATKQHAKKKDVNNNLHHQWWSHVVSGVSAGSHSSTGDGSHSQMTREAHSRSLNELNKMIEAEQNTLAELEKASAKPDPLTDILND